MLRKNQCDESGRTGNPVTQSKLVVARGQEKVGKEIWNDCLMDMESWDDESTLKWSKSEVKVTVTHIVNTVNATELVNSYSYMKFFSTKRTGVTKIKIRYSHCS